MLGPDQMVLDLRLGVHTSRDGQAPRASAYLRDASSLTIDESYRVHVLLARVCAVTTSVAAVQRDSCTIGDVGEPVCKPDNATNSRGAFHKQSILVWAHRLTGRGSVLDLSVVVVSTLIDWLTLELVEVVKSLGL